MFQILIVEVSNQGRTMLVAAFPVVSAVCGIAEPNILALRLSQTRILQ
jgi:hypothetical protein